MAFVINSLTAKSVLAGEKLVLFWNLYVGIVSYILREPETAESTIVDR